MGRRGWDVVGVDVSDGMIQEAMRKSNGSRQPIAFSCQDMRAFSIPAQVGLITCMFDAINHLMNARDLLQCFRCVHRALNPGGYLMFDVNNELCYRTVWRQTEAINDSDFTIVLQNSYDAERRNAKSLITMFLRQGGVYEKKTETVHERYYSSEEIEKLLIRSGFRVVECNDFNFTQDPLVGKIKTWWVAGK
jgi:2-polyprenyl-3-methyl-5-hydroxy-6-metoxy-1,4-benzoquinol methylase